MDQSDQPTEAAPAIEPGFVYSKFESELQVRPDDIDMYQHVHSSRYLDYVLAARFDQMERCYGMAMGEFQKLGFGWVVAATQMNFRRPLVLGDRMIVRCWIEKFSLIGLRLQFEIDRRPDGKRSCDGWFDYVMVSVESGRRRAFPTRFGKNTRSSLRAPGGQAAARVQVGQSREKKSLPRCES